MHPGRDFRDVAVAVRCGWLVLCLAFVLVLCAEEQLKLEKKL
jgi:hypothetical protein